VQRRDDGVVGVARAPAAALGKEDRRQAHALDQLEQPVLLEVAERALRAGEDGVVVGEHRTGPPVDLRRPADEAVGRRAGDQVVEVTPRALRRDRKAPVLHERARVDEVGDVLARRAPAALVALGDGVGPRVVLGQRARRAQLLHLVRHRGRSCQPL
jgi:hypothetical protein